VEVQLHAFLTSALDGGEWSALRPGCFISEEGTLGTRWTDWVSSSDGLDTVAKRKRSPSTPLPGIEPWSSSGAGEEKEFPPLPGD